MDQIETSAAPVEQIVTESPTENIPEYRKIKHKVKIEGQERDVDYDDLVRGYQMETVSQKRFREAREQQQQALSLIDQFKKDPAEVMRQLGLDPDEWSEKRVAKKLDYEFMTPEQRELFDLRNKMSEYENKDKSAREQEEQRRRQEIETQAAEEVDGLISSLMSQAGYKVSPRVLAAAAQELYNDIANDRTLSEETVKQALKRGRDAMASDYGEWLSALPIEEAIKILPQEFQKSLRQFWTKQVTEGKPFSMPKTTPVKSESGSRKQGVRSTVDDFFEKHLKQ